MSQSQSQPQGRRRAARAVALVTAGGCAAALAMTGTAQAATDPSTPAVFTGTTVDTVTGAAFASAGDILGDVRPEIAATGYGAFTTKFPTTPPFAGLPPFLKCADLTSPFAYPAAGGTVQVYTNTARNKRAGDIALSGSADSKITVITPADGIVVPNRPTPTDVDGDGDTDLIVPAGFFFEGFAIAKSSCTGITQGRGSLTWWENQANGSRWIRHDLLTGQVASFHGVEHVDLDGDGLKDIVTVAESANDASSPFDDSVKLTYLPGLGGGAFGSPVVLGNGGGSLPVVRDVDGDGKLDIVSAQYFGGVAFQPVPGFPQSADTASYVWFKQSATDGDGLPGLTAADFSKQAIGTAQSNGFQIIPVPNFRGDGVTRWIATNHTNQLLTSFPFVLYAKPAVFEFTPGADPTAPWSVVQLTANGAIGVTPPAGGGPSNPGQAAPGVVGAGDLDGDGDIDLAISGDGDKNVFTLEQKGDGSFALAVLPGGAGWGQAGGAVVQDFNRDGTNEIVFASFDKNAVGIWQR